MLKRNAANQSERRYRVRAARILLRASGSLVTSSVGPTLIRGPGSHESAPPLLEVSGGKPYFFEASARIFGRWPHIECQSNHNFVKPASGGPGMCRRRSQVRILSMKRAAIKSPIKAKAVLIVRWSMIEYTLSVTSSLKGVPFVVESPCVCNQTHSSINGTTRKRRNITKA